MAKTVADWIQDLSSDTKEVWKEATRALSYIGYDAVSPLLDAMIAGDAPSKRIADTLGLIGQEAIEPIAKMLNDDDDPQHRLQAADVITIIRDVRFLPALIEAASDDDNEVRAQVALALKEFSDPRAVVTLIQLSQVDNDVVRANAALALGSYYRDPRAKPQLLVLTQDESPLVRRGTVRALSAFYHDEEVPSIISAMTNDEHDSVRQYAAAALQSLKGDKMVFQRLDLNSNDITRIANEAYDRMVSDGLLDEDDLDIMRHSNPIVRARLLDAVSDQGRDTAFSLIMPALNDVNPAVRKTAIDAIVRMGSSGIPIMATNLNHPSKYVRAGIVEALGILNDVACLDALATAITDTAVEVRLQAVRVAKKFDDPRAVKIMTIARRDVDREVREIAEERLEELGVGNESGNPVSRFFRRFRGD